MSQFELTPEGSDKLWVETPIPIGQVTWAAWVFSIFPELEQKEIFGVLKGKGDMAPMLIRESRNHRDVISDGEHGHFWFHAYLPFDQRQEGDVARDGVIIVPEEQSHYLTQIIDYLTANDSDASRNLKSMHLQTKERVLALYELFKDYLSGEWDGTGFPTSGFEHKLSSTSGRYDHQVRMRPDKRIDTLVAHTIIEQLEAQWRAGNRADASYIRRAHIDYFL